jgi:predicted nucleic acid-binding protein
MAVVVDASALGAIAFGEPEGPALAAHLEGEALLAPALIDFELMNVAVTKARRRPDLVDEILLSLVAALALPIARVTVPGPDVFALAMATGLTAYDASYLWLARSRDAELVTLDRALVRLTKERN